MSKKANARGVVTLKVGARDVKLKLTLGVLADVEEKLNIESLDFMPNSGKALLFLIERMAEAAGEEVSQEELRSSDLDLQTVMEAVKALSGGTDEPAKNAAAPTP